MRCCLSFIAIFCVEYAFATISVWHRDFPDHIPVYKIRRDLITNEPVSRGRMELIGGFHNITDELKKKVSLSEMKKLLQCAPVEGAMNGQRGSLNLLKFMPPTRESFENAAAWFEGLCHENWNECHHAAIECKTNKTIPNKKCTSHYDDKMINFIQTRLLRVINGSLYRDWPWDAHYFDKEWIHAMMFDLVQYFALPNVAFFKADEIYSSKSQFPIPIFSAAPAMESSDMPWPWPAHYDFEKKLHINAVKKNISFLSSEYYASYAENNIWSKRSSKCVFYGTLTNHRSIFAYIAAKKKKFFHANMEMRTVTLRPLNPLSKEPSSDGAPHRNWSKFPDKTPKTKYTRFGFIRNIMHLPHKFVKYKPSDYKYIAVLMGLDGKSTADRLGALLAYSGAVILLQHSQFEYHFSHKLKPWVHYVPVSYNIADIAEKVDWLIAHDKEAQQIAANGRAFGLSYLRVEDELCYMAQALEVISKLEEGSDVLKPFNATLMTEKHWDYGRIRKAAAEESGQS